MPAFLQPAAVHCNATHLQSTVTSSATVIRTLQRQLQHAPPYEKSACNAPAGTCAGLTHAAAVLPSCLQRNAARAAACATPQLVPSPFPPYGSQLVILPAAQV